MKPSFDIDIVIVNWNAGRLLQACLDSVNAASLPGGLIVQIIVVDNASQDGSADGLKSPHCPLRIIRNNHNAGFAAACNQGARAGDGEFLLFLNPDTEVSAESLGAPWRFLRAGENSSYGVCGIQLRDPQGNIARSCARFPGWFQLLCTSIGLAQALPSRPWGIPMTDWDHQSSREVDHVIGAFYLIRRPLFERLSGFDERYFVYLEDLDLSWRVRQAGFRSYYLTSTHARHIGGGTSHQVKARRLYYSIDSRLKYVRARLGRFAYIIFMPIIMVVEPVIRLSAALAKVDGQAAKETAAAFQMLWAKRLRGRRETRHS